MNWENAAMQMIVFCGVCALFAVLEDLVRARVLMCRAPALSARLSKAVRLLFAQTLVPQESAPFVFCALPAVAFTFVLSAFASAAQAGFDVFGAVFAIYGAALAFVLCGMVSSSRFALIGAARGLTRLCAVASVFPVLAAAIAVSARSPDFTAIQNAQRHIWFIVPHFPLFLIYMAGTLALTNICGGEREKEIARGVETEYAGAPYFVLRLTRLLAAVFLSVAGAYLFLGGGLSPFGRILENGGVWLAVKSAVLFAFVRLARDVVPVMKTGAFVKTAFTRVLPFCLFWLFASAGVRLMLTGGAP